MPGPHLDERADAAARRRPCPRSGYMTPVRIFSSVDLPGAVDADEPDRLARLGSEVDVAQRPTATWEPLRRGLISLEPVAAGAGGCGRRGTASRGRGRRSSRQATSANPTSRRRKNLDGDRRR